jgi:hypothetical protein
MRIGRCEICEQGDREIATVFICGETTNACTDCREIADFFQPIPDLVREHLS